MADHEKAAFGAGSPRPAPTAASTAVDASPASEAWSEEETEELIALYGEHGPRWEKILAAGRLFRGGRTTEELKGMVEQLAWRI